MSTLEQQLRQLLEQSIIELGYHYVGTQRVTVGRHTTLRIYIDSETGISVEDCAKVSRQISAILDVEDLLGVSYCLEVSSPGLDRPLFAADHYARFLGHEVRLLLHTAINNRRKWCGIIQAVIGDTIVVVVSDQKPNQSQEFELSNIREANLVPHF